MKAIAIAVSICLALYAMFAYAQTQRPETPRFVLGVSSDVAWRMDTTTGATSYCFVDNISQSSPGEAMRIKVKSIGCTEWIKR